MSVSAAYHGTIIADLTQRLCDFKLLSSSLWMRQMARRFGVDVEQETAVSLSGTSLRTLVDKWIGVASGIRVTQFSHGCNEQYRFVRVEGPADDRPLAFI